MDETVFSRQSSKYKGNNFPVCKKGGQATRKGWLTTYHPVLPTVYLRFTYGLPTVYLRFTYGLPTVYLRFTYGLPTVYLRFTYGLPTVYLRFTYGSGGVVFFSHLCYKRTSKQIQDLVLPNCSQLIAPKEAPACTLWQHDELRLIFDQGTVKRSRNTWLQGKKLLLRETTWSKKTLCF